VSFVFVKKNAPLAEDNNQKTLPNRKNLSISQPTAAKMAPRRRPSGALSFFPQQVRASHVLQCCCIPSGGRAVWLVSVLCSTSLAKCSCAGCRVEARVTTLVRGSLHTNQFLTRLESLGVKNKNTREAIRNRTVQKTFSMSDMILKFFFVALNSKTDWTLQNLPTEIVNKNMERFNLYLQPPGM